MCVTVLIYLSHSSNYLYNSSAESIKTSSIKACNEASPYLVLSLGWGGVLWDKISYLLSSLEMYTS